MPNLVLMANHRFPRKMHLQKYVINRYFWGDDTFGGRFTFLMEEETISSSVEENANQ